MKLEDPDVLQKYAELIVSVGINLRAGQRLMIDAPIDTRDLVRAITVQAYQAGARLVDVMWGDEQIKLLRFQNAPRDSFEEYPTWRAKALEEHLRNGGAYITLLAEDPDLLRGQDSRLIGIAMQTSLAQSQPAIELITQNATNWLVVSLPVESWATRIFPELTPAEAISRLGEEVVRIVRLDQPNPTAAWREHIRQITQRSAYLNQRRYSAVHFRGPGTDLTVGLPEKHLWEGGSLVANNGIEFVPNMPTEEVFTLPHRDRVDGTVQAALPLSYGGQLIEDFGMTFKDGAVVEFHAGKGEDLLREILEADEGARRLGEVALVPVSSPVAQSGRLFFNTLFDENAASHIALGRAYQTTLEGGEKISVDDFAAAGGNVSLIHVDFMIGSSAMDVDGLLSDGTAEPLMRQGEWVTPV
jgi:aminopeptidase